MRKKHQIFISSTFSDLKLERQAAVESILAAGHIPAGMELFAAGDESQMQVIERWIDDSDVYMLILGGRYGSINPNTGLSYTEHEYDYAISKGKPFFALVLSEAAIEGKVAQLGASYKEQANPDKYSAFRSKVLSKISKPVDDGKDVKIGVLESVRLLESKYALQGWVRSDELPEMAPLVNQLSKLTEENSQLKQKLAEFPVTSLNDGQIQLADLNDLVSLYAEYRISYDNKRNYEEEVALSWGDLFGLIAPKLLSGQGDGYMKTYIAGQLLEHAGTKYLRCSLREQDFQQIKVHLMALNLITVEYSSTLQGGADLFWKLTQLGHNRLLELRATKKQ